MRAALLQIAVRPEETVSERRARAARLVREQHRADLVVLPELWTVGAFSFDAFREHAEPVDGATAAVMSEAAAQARVWLHAGSIVERGAEGTLYNTSLVFAPDGALHRSYRKIHRFGFDRGEAALLGRGEETVTVVPADGGPTAGLATCYDLRFPEQFRLLVDAGAEMFLLPAGWPAARRAHWSLLTRARAVESQAYVLACCTAGTHAGVEQAGHSVVVDPWGEVLAEAGPDEETLVVDLDPALVAKVRAEFPVLRDRVLGVPALR
ncbi:carbon-nitrogen family hydrolase [Streptomyces sp. WMMC940]|uniref:carbon-nitrogen family hydrolase n=1 Tax=Streptomyces sp. WMMC940 TaxID=3015153 RepID=UPI0022B5EA04|nr:carbon-nitrogen family hydrolase [Streptomyces sp. WMMC940]MCZ7458938.1 carbon-nitrogen family hydrolase [Streptomyces sp. WMMC940]